MENTFAEGGIKQNFYSNIAEKISGNKEDLAEHCLLVAARAKKLGGKLGVADECFAMGLFHDAGKFGVFFQSAGDDNTAIDHWSAGAKLLMEHYGQDAFAYAAVIKSQLKGLFDFSKNAIRDLYMGSAYPEKMLLSGEYTAIKRDLYRYIDLTGIPERMKPFAVDTSPVNNMLDMRMLLSVLTDADIYVTSSHFSRDKYGKRIFTEDPPVLPVELAQYRFLTNIDLIMKERRGDAASEYNKRNMKRLAELAKVKKGLYSLKLLPNSLRLPLLLHFALEHASVAGCSRIIIVEPYPRVQDTSNALLERLFGTQTGHSSILQYDNSYAAAGEFEARGDYCSNNWNNPIVLTNSVSFMGALFSASPGDCRKLHNLADSIIIFNDLPNIQSNMAIPVLGTLNRLCTRFNSTVVMSSSVDWPFAHLHDKLSVTCAGFSYGELSLETLEEGKDNTVSNIKWPPIRFDKPPGTKNEAIAEDMGMSWKSLCMMNTKRQAVSMYNLLVSCGEEPFFITSDMCAAHRKYIMHGILESLADVHRRTLCISDMSLVDEIRLSFSRVFCAWAPPETIATSLALCNREGKLKSSEFTLFFNEREDTPDMAFKECSDSFLQAIIKTRKFVPSLDDKELMDKYFKIQYPKEDHKGYGIKLLTYIENYDFLEVQALFHMLKRNVINLLVPFDEDAYQIMLESAQKRGVDDKWISAAKDHYVCIYEPTSSDDMRVAIEKLPSKAGGEPWFFLRDKGMYDEQLGLAIPITSSVQIG